jgi:ubiquinone/menaquinone biosynthesis C-methylase UbiE
MANAYDSVIAPLDSFGLRRWREWAINAAHGYTLEIGVGTGLNLPHYRNTRFVAAIDPDNESLQSALNRCRGKMFLQTARAEELPFANDVFDAVVGTLTFCSIGAPGRALDEIRRVLKPGGALRLVEHVRVKNRLGAAVQDALTPYWKQIAGNCHLNRDTLSTVEQAGFEMRQVKRLLGGLLIGIDAILSEK